jgi:hypothetical protein
MAGSSDGSSGSGPGGGKRRRPLPPVLDLKATDVTPDQPATPPRPPERPPETPEPAPPAAESGPGGKIETMVEAMETSPPPAPPPQASPPASPQAAPETSPADLAADQRRQAGAAEPPPAPPPDRPGHAGPPARSTSWHPAALIVGAGAGAAAGALALLTVAWLFGLPLAGSDDRAAEAAARVQALEKRVGEMAARPAPAATPDRRVDDLLARIAQLEKAPRVAAGSADAETAKRIAAIEDAGKALTTALTELRARVDEAVTVARAAREAATRSSGTSSETAAHVSADIETLGKRIAALEDAAKALQAALVQARVAEVDRPARLAAAAFALRSAVESGAPFAGELAVVKTLTAPAKVAPLEPFAAAGVPSPAALARELSALIVAARKPPPGSPQTGESAGWWERLQASAAKLVRVRPADAPPTLDPADALARIQASAARGDLSAALAEAAKLPAPARAPIEPWIKRAEARGQALAAARELFSDGLKNLAARTAEPGTR